MKTKAKAAAPKKAPAEKKDAPKKEVKANPMDRISEELFKLGFGGGEMNKGGSKVKATRSYLFRSVKRSPLVLVVSRDKKSKEITSQRGMRLKSESEVELDVTLTTKDNSVKWDYATAAQDKFAKGSSGLHSKLVRIFGKSN